MHEQFTLQGFCNASTSETMNFVVVCKYDGACLYIVYIIRYLLEQQGERKKIELLTFCISNV